MNEYKIVKHDPVKLKVRHNFPWDEIQTGMGFIVPPEQIKLQTLRALSYQAGIRLKKKFCVLDYKDHYEVARLF